MKTNEKHGLIDFMQCGLEIWARTSSRRWVCGRIRDLGRKALLLEDTSWIDHTGDFWSEALKKGWESEGWESEYQGYTVIPTATLSEVIPLEPGRLPKTTIRPSSDESHHYPEFGRASSYTEGESGLFLAKEDPVWISTLGGPWSIGVVEDFNEDAVLLRQCSWIDHTGDFWSKAITRGYKSPGWHSEYQGQTILSSSTITEIILLPTGAGVPTESCRPTQK